MAEPTDMGAEEMVLAGEFRAPLLHERALPGPPDAQRDPAAGAAVHGTASVEQEGAVVMEEPRADVKAPQPEFSMVSALFGHDSLGGAAKGSLSSNLLAWSWEAAPACEVLGTSSESAEVTVGGGAVGASSQPLQVMPASVADRAVVEALGMPHRGIVIAGPAPNLPPAEAEAARRSVTAAGSEVFVDLMGYTTEGRMALRRLRPAPVNVQYLGFPGTTGTAFSDYMVSDSAVLPPERLYMHATARSGVKTIREACASRQPAALLRAAALLRPDYPLPLALLHCNGSAALEQTLPPGCPEAIEAARRGASSIRRAASGGHVGTLVWASEEVELPPVAGHAMGRWQPPPHPANAVTEGLIVLPHVYQVHEKPLSAAACMVRDSPCVRSLRRHWGIPEDGVILGSIGSSARTILSDLQAWAGILRRSSGDTMLAVLGCRLGSERCNSVRSTMAGLGVPPWRVLCVPKSARASHVSRVGMLDLVLDSSNYNAHSTAAEVLAVGVPIATMRGDRFEARVGAALLRAAATGTPSSWGGNLLETMAATLVHDSARAFQGAVTRLAARPESLWQLRRRLARAAAFSPLHDASGTTQALERGYRAATDVRRAQVSGAFGSLSHRAVAPACGRQLRQPPPAAAVAPAATVQPGGWLPFHIVLQPLRGEQADAQQRAVGNDKLLLLARAAYRHAVGWTIECDAAEMADRLSSPGTMGPAGASSNPVIRVPIPPADGVAGQFLAAALRGERVPLRAPPGSQSEPCAVPPVASDSMRGGASYNIEAARSLVARWSVASDPTPIRKALCSWLHGVVWAAAELWHLRRAATLVAASWDKAKKAPALAAVFAAGDTRAAGGPEQWEAQLRTSNSSALIVTVLDSEHLLRSAGDVWSSPSAPGPGVLMDSINGRAACSALQVRLTPPDGSGYVGGSDLDQDALFWVRDVGVGLWDTAAGVSDEPDPERAAAAEHGGLRLLPGARTVMGAHKEASAAGTSAWVPCSSSGCGDYATGLRNHSGATRPRHSGWRVALAMLQAEHAAQRATSLTMLAEGTRRLRELAAEALNSAQQQLQDRPAVLVVSQEVNHTSAARCAVAALEAAGRLVDSPVASGVLAQAAGALDRELEQKQQLWSRAAGSEGVQSSRQLAAVQRRLAELGVLFVAPARTGLASRALASAADLDSEAVAVVTAVLAARLAEHGAGLLAPSTTEVRDALGRLARSSGVRVTAVSLSEVLAALTSAVLGRVAEDSNRVTQATAAAVLCQVQASRALSELSPATVEATVPGVVRSGAGLELALVGPTKLLFAANSLEAALTATWLPLHAGGSVTVDWAAAATYTRLMQGFSAGYWRNAHAAASKAEPGGMHLAERRFVPRPDDRPTVVLIAEEFGQGWFEGWGPWYDKPVGGSEEAAMQVVASLDALCQRHGGRMCVHVEVYKPVVPAEARGRALGGAVWYPTTWLDPTQAWPPGGRGNVVVMLWRYPASIGMLVRPAEVRDVARRIQQSHGSPGEASAAARASALSAATNGRLGGVYAWVHDTLAPAQVALARQTSALFTGVFTVSSYHSSVSAGATAPPGMFQVVRNGAAVELDQPSSPAEREPGLIVYTSAPNRGLWALLQQWQRIRAAAPHARLEVFYGFTQGFVTYLRSSIGKDRAAQWTAKVKQLLKQPGIIMRGMVSAAELATAYRRASFFAYPTAFKETGCIALVKAMAFGALPLTSRFPESVLPELIGDLDLGPPLPAHLRALVDRQGNVRQDPEVVLAWNMAGTSYFESEDFASAFGDALISALQRDGHPDFDALRRQLRKRVEDSLTWEAAARTMLQRWQDDGLL